MDPKSLSSGSLKKFVLLHPSRGDFPLEGHGRHLLFQGAKGTKTQIVVGFLCFAIEDIAPEGLSPPLMEVCLVKTTSSPEAHKPVVEPSSLQVKVS